MSDWEPDYEVRDGYLVVPSADWNDEAKREMIQAAARGASVPVEVVHPGGFGGFGHNRLSAGESWPEETEESEPAEEPPATE